MADLLLYGIGDGDLELERAGLMRNQVRQHQIELGEDARQLTSQCRVHGQPEQGAAQLKGNDADDFHHGFVGTKRPPIQPAAAPTAALIALDWASQLEGVRTRQPARSIALTAMPAASSATRHRSRKLRSPGDVLIACAR